jgi:hypothetical protein
LSAATCRRTSEELWGSPWRAGRWTYRRPLDQRLAVDAYCVQHAAYVESAKSLAAHLCGLCIAFEDVGAAAALQNSSVG